MDIADTAERPIRGGRRSGLSGYEGKRLSDAFVLSC
jgi:hypothetical protein